MLAKTYLDTIALFSCGMKGVLPEEKRFDMAEIEQIEKNARMQGVWPVVFAVLKKLSERGRAEISDAQLSTWQMEINLKVMEYTLRQEAMYRFLEEELAFCNPVMLKGDLLSDLYANPELRFSGDTDILIHPEHEKKVLEAFTAAGGEFKPRSENNNQAVCVHPKAGLFEIHVSLDTKEVAEVWYDNLDFGSEEKRTVTLKNGHTVTALGITDGAINMVLHFLKHFISGIAHLKMLGDSLLYLAHYAGQIDFARVDAVMQQLRYTRMYEAMKQIGIQYFGFSNLTVTGDAGELAQKVLSDVQFCAEQGFSEEALSLYNEYSQRRYESYHKKNYGAYKSALSKKETIGRLFPKKTMLYKEYPILVRLGWLLPFVWVIRIFRKMVAHKQAIPAQTDSRRELMKELDLL